MYLSYLLLLTFVIVLAASNVTAQIAGSLDPGFNPSLMTATGVGALVLQPDGKILLGGSVGERVWIARYDPDGTMEDPSTFNLVAGFGGIACLALQEDGKILFGTGSGNGAVRARIGRLHPDGAPDATFSPPVFDDSTISRILVQADGKILVSSFKGIRRLHPNGVVESTGSFNPGTGVGPGGYIGTIAMQADGKILVTGNFDSFNAQPRHNLVRLHPDGTLEDSTTFDPDIGTDEFISDIEVQGDGKLLLVTYTFVNQYRGRLVRLHPDGSLESPDTFRPEMTTTDINDAVVQPDGKILATSFTSVNGQPLRHITRLGADGTLESTTTFRQGIQVEEQPYSANPDGIALQPDGKILLAGYIRSVNGQPRIGVARLHPDGTLESSDEFRAIAAAHDASISTAAVQPDGKILVVGNFNVVNGEWRDGIARLNADGTLERSTFGARIEFNGFPIGHDHNNIIGSIVVQPDRQILLTGGFRTINGQPRSEIARLNPDGTLESTATFHPDATFMSVGGVAVQPDRKIIISAGIWGVDSPPARFGLYRLHPDGTLESPVTFKFVDTTARCIAVQPDGRILLAGGFNRVNGQIRRVMARLYSDGTLESPATFNPESQLNGNSMAMALLAEGKILLGGNGLTNVDGSYLGCIARFRPNGTLEVSASCDPSTVVNTIGVQANGMILIGGNFTSVNGQPRSRIARLHPDGTLESTTTFDPGTGPNDEVTGIALQPDGGILLTGKFSSVDGKPRSGIARLTNDPMFQDLSSVDGTRVEWDRGGATPEVERVSFELSSDSGKSWIPLGAGTRVPGGWELTGLRLPESYHIRAKGSTTGGVYNRSSGFVEQTFPALPSPPEYPFPGSVDYTFIPEVDGAVDAIAVQPNDKVLLGGSFTGVAGTERNHLARVNGDDSLDTVFNPNVDGRVSCLSMQGDGKILAGGFFGSSGGLPRQNFVRLLPDGVPDAGFHPDPDGRVLCTAVQPDGMIIIGGGFFLVAGAVRPFLARLDADGSLDTGFSPAPTSSVLCLAVQPDGRIVVGGAFTTLGGMARQYIARLHPDGTLDTGFDPKSSYPVHCLTVQEDGKIIAGGDFTSMGGITRHRIARLLPDGSVDASFNAGALDGTVRSLALQTDRRILIGGNFSTVNGLIHPRFARLNSDGTLDAEIRDAGIGGIPDASVSSLALQADGKILLGGGLFAWPRSGLVRVVNNPAPATLQNATTGMRWMRGGSSPEVDCVSFDVKPSGAVDWTTLGDAHRIAGGWEMNGLSLPPAGEIRASGRAGGSLYESIEPIRSALEQWRLQHFNTAAINTGSAADAADPDNDNIPNLIEYALGLDPNQNSTGMLPNGAVIGSDFVLSVTQPAAVSGVTYGAEWSTALGPGSWTAIADTGSPPQHSFRVPIGTNPKLFLRLKVSAP